MIKKKYYLAIFSIFLVSQYVLSLDVPTFISFQGKLSNSTSGDPFTPASLRINITNQSQLAQVEWGPYDYDDVTDNQGVFDLVLGRTNELNLTPGWLYQLVVQVDIDSATFTTADLTYGDLNPSGDNILIKGGAAADATEILMADNTTTVEAAIQTAGGVTTSCTSGQVLKNQSGSWQCADDVSGAGSAAIPFWISLSGNTTTNSSINNGNVHITGRLSMANSSANASSAVAMGYSNPINQGSEIWASGVGSFAMGYGDGGIKSTGDGAVAMGYSFDQGIILSSGDGSIAMGYASNQNVLRATGQASVALGQDVEALADNAFALGNNFNNSEAGSFKVGFDPTPTLIVNDTSVIVDGNVNMTRNLTVSDNLGIGVTPTRGDRLRIDGNITFSSGATRVIQVDSPGSGNGTNLTIQASDSGCFAAGTLVTMGDGSYKNIEDVGVGDFVLSYDTLNKKFVSARVTQTFHHTPDVMGDHYLIVKTSSGLELKVTPNHPIYVNGLWLTAGELRVGDVLLNDVGSMESVDSIEKVFEEINVYNLEVDETHAYFAGILVHNKIDNAVNGGYLFLFGGAGGTGGVEGDVILAYTGTVARGRVGIGTSKPTHNLTVIGDVNVTGSVAIGAYILPNTDGTSNQVLKTDGGGGVTWGDDVGGGSAGIPYWIDSGGSNPYIASNTTINDGNVSVGGYLFVDGIDPTVYTSELRHVKLGYDADNGRNLIVIPAGLFAGSTYARISFQDGSGGFTKYLDYYTKGFEFTDDLTVSGNENVTGNLTVTGRLRTDYATASGINAVALGVRTKATNTGSVAMGNAAEGFTPGHVVAQGMGAIAVGYATSPGAVEAYINASGAGAVAMGFASSGILQATGTGSISMGSVTKATADSAIAMGSGSAASATSAIAMGSGSAASATAAVALGNTAQASGDSALAAGYKPKAMNHSSVALGNETVARGIGSFAVGYRSNASGPYSFAAGYKAEARGAYSIAMGYGGGTSSAYLHSNNVGSVAMGYASSGAIISNGFGSVAIGETETTGNITASNSGSIAMGMTGSSFEATQNILSSGLGSVAMGAAYDGSIMATGLGSVAIGQNVQAKANNAISFGKDVINTNSSTLMIGFEAPATLIVNTTKVLVPDNKVLCFGTNCDACIFWNGTHLVQEVPCSQ